MDKLEELISVLQKYNDKRKDLFGVVVIADDGSCE